MRPGDPAAGEALTALCGGCHGAHGISHEALTPNLAGLLAFFFPAFDEIRETLAFGIINLSFMLVAVLIQRRAFMVVGGVGLFTYLVYLAGDLFRDSLLFPVALSGIGLVLIFGGVAYARREDRIREWIMRRLPPGAAAALPQNRAPAATRRVTTSAADRVDLSSRS